MTAIVAFFTTNPEAMQTALILSVAEGPFQTHHEMRCEHGATEMHTPRAELSVDEVAALAMGHQAKTGCNCGTRYEAVVRATRPH